MSEARKIGTYATDTLTGKTVIVLTMHTTAGVANGNPIKCQRLNTDYQVTAGKTFYITAFQVIGQCYWNASSDLAAVFSYADDAGLTTNRVDIASVPGVNTTPGNTCNLLIPIQASVPATKYCGVYNNSGGNAGIAIIVYGYEA